MQWPTAVKDLSCPNTTLYSVHFEKLTGAARRFKFQIEENSRFTINRFKRKQKQGINVDAPLHLWEIHTKKLCGGLRCKLLKVNAVKAAETSKKLIFSKNRF